MTQDGGVQLETDKTPVEDAEFAISPMIEMLSVGPMDTPGFSMLNDHCTSARAVAVDAAKVPASNAASNFFTSVHCPVSQAQCVAL